MQSLNQDVQAHEGTIQSAKDKAEELASKSPDSKVISDTAQIAEQYGNLQTNVKVRLALSVRQLIFTDIRSCWGMSSGIMRLKIKQAAY